MNITKSCGRIPIIAEIKRYSPSSGDLFKGRDVEQIIQDYISGGAAFISVVTGKWFHGDLALLERIAKLVSLPILRKDFIVNREQIKITKDYGSNAVLLTKKLLKTKHLMDLTDYCISIGITPFIEAADASELKKLQLNSYAIIAINNKNISIKESDSGGIKKSLLLHKAATKCGAGAKISASGISTPEQARLLFFTGFDALLIGTALLKAKNTEEAVKKFTQINDFKITSYSAHYAIIRK